MNYLRTFSRINLIAWSTIALIFFMYFIAPHIAQAKFLFETRIDYDAGCSSVAIGDLDADLDLVTNYTKGET